MKQRLSLFWRRCAKGAAAAAASARDGRDEPPDHPFFRLPAHSVHEAAAGDGDVVSAGEAVMAVSGCMRREASNAAA